MKVEVKLFGGLRVYTTDRGRQFSFELPEGSTGKDLLVALGVPPSEVWLVGVNGDLAEEDRILSDGDRVMLIEPVGGGGFGRTSKV